MSKKLSKNIDSFEDYKMLAIVSHLKDYTLCYHINQNLRLDLIKYEDIDIAHNKVDENSFSWYYFKDNISSTTYYLLGNKNGNRNLIPSQKTVDYFLLIKDIISDKIIIDIVKRLRSISSINAVFDIQMLQIKDMDLLIESIELHELQFVKRRSDKGNLL